MNFDVIVVGLGAMGSATLYQLAQRGAKVLGIDQFDPPHTQGSTHGESRVTRLAVGEGSEYIPLVRRTHEIWRELESQTGESLLHISGGYILCPLDGGAGWHGGGNFAVKTAVLAQQFGIEHELLSADEIRQRHPIVRVENHFQAYYEPTGGVVDPEAAVRTQLRIAKELGARAVVNEPVLDVNANASGVTVVTANGRYQADKVIISAGAWVKHFLPERWQRPFQIYRQAMYWFAAEDLSRFSVEQFPFLLWIGETEEDYFGAFPVAKGNKPAVKLLTEQYIETCDPTTVSRDVTQAEIAEFTERFVPRKLHYLTQRCLAAHACLYTVTPDEHFVIDWHPESERIMIVSPCSGHGFKHSAAIGESVAQWVWDGKSEIDLSKFSLDRFGH